MAGEVLVHMPFPGIHGACLVPPPALPPFSGVCLGFSVRVGWLIVFFIFTSVTPLIAGIPLSPLASMSVLAPRICLRILPESFLFPTLSTSPLSLLPSVSAALGCPSPAPMRGAPPCWLEGNLQMQVFCVAGLPGCPQSLVAYAPAPRCWRARRWR